MATLGLGLCSFGVQFAAARPAPLIQAVNDFNTVQASFTVLDVPRTFGNSQQYRVNIKIFSAEIGKAHLNLKSRGELRGGQEIANLYRRPVIHVGCNFVLLKIPTGPVTFRDVKTQLVKLASRLRPISSFTKFAKRFLTRVEAQLRSPGAW